MFRNLFNSVCITLCLSPTPRHVLHWALHRHPKYNYSLQLNGEEWSSGIHRNRKWSGGLYWGGNGKSLIHLAKPWQQAPGDSYRGISGIKQCSSNCERKFYLCLQTCTQLHVHWQKLISFFFLNKEHFLCFVFFNPLLPRLHSLCYNPPKDQDLAGESFRASVVLHVV